MHVPRDLMVLALEEKGWETTQKVQEGKEAACPVLSPFLREKLRLTTGRAFRN